MCMNSFLATRFDLPVFAHRCRQVAGTLSGALIVGLMTAGHAAERTPAAEARYPIKPIRLLVAQAAGGNSDFVARLYLKLLPLMHFNYSAINPVALKSLMRAIGLPVGALRKPLRNLEGEALMQGVRIVKELGLDKKYGYKIQPKLAYAA